MFNRSLRLPLGANGEWGKWSMTRNQASMTNCYSRRNRHAPRGVTQSMGHLPP
jgi:hypothetical protein